MIMAEIGKLIFSATFLGTIQLKLIHVKTCDRRSVACRLSAVVGKVDGCSIDVQLLNKHRMGESDGQTRTPLYPEGTPSAREHPSIQRTPHQLAVFPASQNCVVVTN